MRVEIGKGLHRLSRTGRSPLRIFLGWRDWQWNYRVGQYASQQGKDEFIWRYSQSKTSLLDHIEHSTATRPTRREER